MLLIQNKKYKKSNLQRNTNMRTPTKPTQVPNTSLIYYCFKNYLTVIIIFNKKYINLKII